MPTPPILSHQDRPIPAVAAPEASRSLRVVLAPNAFKGSLTAREAAESMARGVQAALPGAVTITLPVADGGDGSVDAFLPAGFTRVPLPTRGPTGVPGWSAIAVRSGVGVVELADACGLMRLPDGTPAPMTSSTLGLGDAIRGALEAGVDSLLVCLGGSASTDGGSGALVALGARLLDAHGNELEPCGAALAEIQRLDLSGLDPRLAHVAITVAVDVTSPLFGVEGAATVFAPQKGADAAQVAALDAGLRAWARVLEHATGADVSLVPGAGAAGGTASGLLAALGATLAPGAQVIADAVGLDAHLAGADLALTGEGRLDAQSALGKGAVLVAERANAEGTPVLVVAGRIDLSEGELRRLGYAGWASCTSYAAEESEAITRAAALVERATADVVRRWAEA